ncbi:hypothetical protein LINPERHAP2_LOCUS16019 [Linum perenne]
MQVHKPQVVVILEPRISGAVRAVVHDKMGFNSSFIVEVEGFRGGIWLLWNDLTLSLKIVASTSQLIHAEIEWEVGKVYFATFIYASPGFQGRRMLWNDLCQVAAAAPHAWVLLGDFNAMVNSTEKWGGATFNQGPAREFRSYIGDCNLIDMGFFSPKFTWFRRILRERLDRCLGNAEWSTVFPDAVTYHLERLKFNHRPILIRSKWALWYTPDPRPFRFNAAWFGHENFTNFLDLCWKRGRSLCSSLLDFQEQCVV